MNEVAPSDADVAPTTWLELTMRSFERWTGARLTIDVYVLSRLGWEDSRYDVAYGLPVRVGRLSLATPAAGDEVTVALWSEILHGNLPRVAGMPRPVASIGHDRVVRTGVRRS